MIFLKNLQKYFNKGRSNEIHVINDITLELPERGMVAFFGPSGCGKTTLLNVIGGLDGFESGSLEINGHSILENTDAFRNQNIGYIFQNYNLNKAETVFENVADALRLCGMTDPETVSRRVLAALSNVGMEKYRNRLPDSLSGGQQQRVAIARAIVKNPPIILADEPTGNLDEANTVLVMELLKEISRDHLVLLVTHEADLVDLYCDKVVGLSDGRIISVKDQEGDGAYAGRSHSDIWLGELPEEDADSDIARIRYYGEKPGEPLAIRVVRYQGKTYLKIDTPDVRVLDESSETRLREGTFTENRDTARAERKVDLSALPPFTGTRFGRLFGFASSVKSGYRSNFTVKKKGSRFFRLVLFLFAAVSVFIVSRFGVVFRDLAEADAAYNHNVFYYPLKSDDKASFADQIDPSSGIDAVLYTTGLYVDWDTKVPNEPTLNFVPGNFETFDTRFGQYISASGVMLPISAASSCEVLAGRKDNLSPCDVVLSRATADKLLDASHYGFIKTYADLIGLAGYWNSYNIAGVVDSDETAFYMGDFALARAALDTSFLESDFDTPFEVPAGKFLYLAMGFGGQTPENIPSSVTVNGRTFTIDSALSIVPWNTKEDYGSWMKQQGLSKMTAEEYAVKLVPECADNEALLTDTLDRLYFDYLDYYYDQFASYIEVILFAEPMEEYYWASKGDPICIAELTEPNRLYATYYKEQHGEYPTRSFVETGTLETQYGSVYKLVQALYDDFAMVNDFENYRRLHTSYHGTPIYVFNSEDYNTLAYSIGKTVIPDYYVSENAHLVLHSADPEKTEEWLTEHMSSSEREKLFSPDTVRESLLKQDRASIMTNVLTIVILMALMSLCMYFIMRSSLMGRVKEVGIYRAIGVSKSNILFRFSVESLTLAALTVIPGWLVSSLIIGRWLAQSVIFKTMFYYPLWVAIALLMLLVLISVFCGTLPVISLMRRKPAEILAKYDI